ncbi:MAG: nucleotide exchange factor GrpE [Gammaproteobacteria bacterium RIFCSPHIGHO2_12_FULL_41_20]|nr:MAG: nucleotide exchange factor GrpE [Gammaproteobacteria bacterium RIFCSPHIGHO2_12_FULL_41_20]
MSHDMPPPFEHKQQEHAARDEKEESTVASEQLSLASHEELLKRLNEAEEKTNQYWDRILRLQAENENSQRRAEREIANAHKYGLEKFAMELLPVIDSLERCVLTEANDLAALLDGVKLTLKMFYGVLERAGIQQISPEGKPFNPEYHQAVSTQENIQVEPGCVITVLQKGYLLNNRLIRPALVVVAKKPGVEK